MLKKTLWGLLALLVLLATAVAINTVRKGSRQLAVAPLAPVAVDADAVATRLAEAVRLQTISSRDDAQLSADQFQALHALLQTRFPKVHATLQREVVGDLSLLYTWQGADPKAPPILLMAHQDVVPVAPGTEGDWQVPPFAGEVKDFPSAPKVAPDPDRRSLTTAEWLTEFFNTTSSPVAARRPASSRADRRHRCRRHRTAPRSRRQVARC